MNTKVASKNLLAVFDVYTTKMCFIEHTEIINAQKNLINLEKKNDKWCYRNFNVNLKK